MTLLWHYYTYYFSNYFSYYVTFRLLFFLLWHYYDTIIPIISLLFFIISGVHVPIERSWQTPILVLCAKRWLISVQERQQYFGMNRRACFINTSQHIQLYKDYYTYYFFYYTNYFDYLTRNEQVVTSTYALQADIQRIYELYHSME
jgi:hypothetical protein